jgi:Predicted bile acid beta-glucosidase
MILTILRSGIAITLLATTSLWALAQTMGTPIGGMGTGYIVYNARTGDFATSGKIMPPASDAVSEFSNKQSTSSGFHFFANGQSKIKATTTTEDAKCPVYTADFGATGGVTFTLTAFGPFIPGSNPLYTQLAHSPLAYFEITATNGNAAAVDAAVALEFTNQSSTVAGLLGGANTGTSTASSKALAYGTTATENAYLLAGCSDASASYSTGAIGTFATSGVLSGGDGNIVSAKSNIAANGSVRFKFVFAWWRQFRNPTRGNEDYYYHNFYTNSQAAAEFGMTNFDAVKSGATSIVSRVMACNFPDWYKDRLLNNLYPLIHNSQCAKDGRVGFWEGRYPIIGTIDQGEHAALWYIFNWPSNQWRELQFWARSAHTGVGEATNLKGQIHHDFNAGPSSWTTDAHFMFAWDDYLHADYWYQVTTTDWSDLNAMFIYKAYELMLATGDRDSLTKYWPYLKNTADRIIVQCGSTHLPTNSKSTYDNGGIMATYASGTALTAFLAMAEMAKFLNDAASATKYSDWYTAGRAEFAPTYFNSTFGTGKNTSESDVAGYSWARYFGFPAIMDSNVVTTGCNRLWTYYSAQSSTRAKLGGWHFYTYDHWGGAAIAIGQQDTAMAVNKWDYDYYYTANPGYVFWQDLQATNNTYASYMTAPCAWRSLFQMTGYLLDNANNRLWIRPMVPSTMAKKITSAPLINPTGWGTLTYDETISGSRFQNMTVTFDSLITVKQIVLKNNTGTAAPGVTVTNNGTAVTGATVAAEGSGYEKNIRVTFSSPIQIGPQGATIQVFNTAQGVTNASPFPVHPALSIHSSRIISGKPVLFTVDVPGRVSLDLIGINGAMICTILNTPLSAGPHEFMWDGGLNQSARVGSGMAVLRLSSSGNTITKTVFIGK